MTSVYLLTLSLIFQADAPEEVFKKIEQSLEKANGLRVIFRVEVLPNNGVKYEASGTVLAKNPDKVNIQMTLTDGTKTSMISDGSKMRVMIAGQGGDAEVHKGIKDNIAIALSRAGLYLSQGTYVPVFSKPLQEGKGVREVLGVSKFKFGEEEQNLKTILYEIKLHGEATLEAKLWYEGKTLKPVKRVVKAKVDKQETVHTETFGEWTIGVDLPDELFALPPTK